MLTTLSVFVVLSSLMNAFSGDAMVFAMCIPCSISWFGINTLSSVESILIFRTTCDLAARYMELLPELYVIGT